jgi:hypothetical protein
MRICRIEKLAVISAALLASGGARAQAVDLSAYNDRFQAMWRALHDSKNGYFSPEGVPYHAPETFLIEAPDYGHETTSEAFSYWLWLEAAQGRLTGDWTPLGAAWSTLETRIIPSTSDQPTNSFYNAGKPATYAPEGDDPSAYPARLDFGVSAGQDPLADELASAYGTKDVYGMHWLLDVDNWYGFGNRADGTSKVSYINTFQRGPQESVWETVPQPCWDSFRSGFGGKNGYLDLFVGDNSYARQWKYSNAPDADARAVQALYWASVWAQAQGKSASAVPAAKASRLGDYLRYALFDKYFKTLGCQSLNCQPGSDRTSALYLLTWYYAWGGAIDASSGWAWRIGSSHAHFGYQNPMAAYALSQVPALKPISSKAPSDWAESLQRQLEFYQWLQSSEGAIAGGATNSWNGRYEAFPAGVSTFHGLAYVEAPVFRDPPSNRWFGWQAWSMQRLAEYYLVTGDAAAGGLLDRWVAWVKAVVQLPADGTYQIPSTLGWSGQPQTWTGAYVANAQLHVNVVSTTSDVGIAASLARTLSNYAAAKAKHAGAEDAAARNLARELLDRMWTLYRDDKGVSSVEEPDEYNRIFNQAVYVPAGWSGTMPNGDLIKPGVTFLDIRSKYKQDPSFASVQSTIANGQRPQMRYHRFWAQVEVALANADYARLFSAPSQANNLLPNVKITSPAASASFTPPANIQVRADASDPDGRVAKVELFVSGTKVGEAVAAPYAIQWTGVGEGRYVLVATATDNLGARSSDQVEIVVGNPPPIPGADGGSLVDGGGTASDSGHAGGSDGAINPIDGGGDGGNGAKGDGGASSSAADGGSAHVTGSTAGCGCGASSSVDLFASLGLLAMGLGVTARLRRNQRSRQSRG